MDNSMVKDTAKALSRSLGIPARDCETALRTARRHTPHDATPEDREDLLQHLALTALEVRPSDGAYLTALLRGVTRNWARAWYRRQHTSLDSTPATEDSNAVSAADWATMLVGTMEFEAATCSKLDIQALWHKLPPDIREAVHRRIVGVPLTKAQHNRLDYWRRRHPMMRAMLAG